MNTRLYTTILTILSAAMLFAVGFHTEAAAANNAEATKGQKPIINTLPPEEVGQQANKLLVRINAAVKSGLQYDTALENASAEDPPSGHGVRHLLQ